MIANTFVIGAMKSATTSLCDHLDRHPNVFVARPKEPDFFSRDEVYAKGLPWYESLFSSATNKLVAVDGSTSYTKELQYPETVNRIARHVPEAKLIYIVRHPIERMQSHWSHEVLKGRTKLKVNDFVRTHPEVIDISCYWRQLQAYRERFSDDQILLLFLEDLRDDPAETLGRCCEFLGLGPVPSIEVFGNANQSSRRRLDVWPIRFLRKYRWFDLRFEQFKQKVPTGFHETLKRIFKGDKQIGSSALSNETVRWAIEELGDDPIRFLKHCGKSRQYWKLDSILEKQVG